MFDDIQKPSSNHNETKSAKFRQIEQQSYPDETATDFLKNKKGMKEQK